MSERMSATRKAGIAATAVLLGGTLVAGGLVGQAAAAHSLEPQASAALQQAGITGVDVSFKGREAYLTGQGMTPDQLAQAKQVVEAVHGVRWAVISGDNSNNATASASPSSLASSAAPTSPPPSVTPSTASSSSSPSSTVSTGTPTPTGNGATPTGTPSTSTTPTGTPSTGTPSTSTTPTTSQTSTSTSSALSKAEIAKIENTVIQFDSGAYSLNAAAKQKLDTIIGLLAKSTNKITIRGYVSSPHPAARQTQDSKQRAQAVADYLISKGISASRITVKGMGTADPIASNSTRAGRTANQRATMTIS